jgi:imidazolonepropionase-like amidohydrolase
MGTVAAPPVSEVEAMRARVHGQVTLDDDVALVLRMGVTRRRGVFGKEELDQGVTAADRLAGTRIVARVPTNHSRSPSPEADHVASPIRGRPMRAL